MQLFNVYQGGTLIFDIPTVTSINGHAKVQGTCQKILTKSIKIFYTKVVCRYGSTS